MTDELKKALESAKTEEEKKAVADKYKDEIKKLNPEDLKGIAGGTLNWDLTGIDKGLRTHCENKNDVH